MLHGNITGIDPFVSWSTFRGPTLNIPRGLFYGGIFYTSEQYTPPCHVSYISGQEDELLLSTWGIADASGKELAQIYFEINNPVVGKILTLNGEYAGCLKGRPTNFNQNAVEIISGSTLIQGVELEVFLRSIRGEHVLNPDSLIFDACVCTGVPKNPTTAVALDNITLPPQYVLSVDDRGSYYLAENENSGPTVNGLSSLTIVPTDGRAVTLTGEYLSITPWTIEGSYTVSGGVVDYTNSVGGEDIGIKSVGGGLVIGPISRVK